MLQKRNRVEVVRGRYFKFYRLPSAESPLHDRLLDLVKSSLGAQQLFDEDVARLRAVQEQPAGARVCRSVLRVDSEQP